MQCKIQVSLYSVLSLQMCIISCPYDQDIELRSSKEQNVTKMWYFMPFMSIPAHVKSCRFQTESERGQCVCVSECAVDVYCIFKSNVIDSACLTRK